MGARTKTRQSSFEPWGPRPGLFRNEFAALERTLRHREGEFASRVRAAPTLWPECHLDEVAFVVLDAGIEGVAAVRGDADARPAKLPRCRHVLHRRAAAMIQVTAGPADRT